MAKWDFWVLRSGFLVIFIFTYTHSTYCLPRNLAQCVCILEHPNGQACGTQNGSSYSLQFTVTVCRVVLNRDQNITFCVAFIPISMWVFLYQSCTCQCWSAIVQAGVKISTQNWEVSWVRRSAVVLGFWNFGYEGLGVTNSLSGIFSKVGVGSQAFAQGCLWSTVSPHPPLNEIPFSENL